MDTRYSLRDFWSGLLIFIVFAVLIILGFITTPSMFHNTNYEYGRNVPSQIIRLEELNRNLQKLKADQQALIKESVDLGVRVYVRSDADYAKGRSQSLAMSSGATARRSGSSIHEDPEEKARLDALEIRENKINDLEVKKSANEALIQALYEDIEESKRSIEKYSSESNNAYLVTRALALGSLGALANLLSKKQMSIHPDLLITADEKRYFLSSIIRGSLVSVSVFALFYTKQISIFQNQETNGSLPEYWRVTVLCLIAGAFAESLYSAASDRVSKYIQNKPEAK